jgi:ATP-binding cassette subfamily F protein uup
MGLSKSKKGQPIYDAGEISRLVGSRLSDLQEQRELAGMEAAILDAESRVSELETMLNDPAFYISRSREAPALLEQLESAKTEVARLYDRWHELDQIPQ